MKASEGRLIAEARGEVESDDGVLVLRRIHVTYRRAFDLHPPKCPVYRSIGAAVEITTSVELSDL